MLLRTLPSSSLGKVILTASFTIAALLVLATFAGFTTPITTLSSLYGGNNSSRPLTTLALEKVLSDAGPVFGESVHAPSNKSDWMKAYPDDTLLTRMNIPGTHDAATWNYSLATQQYLDHVTDLVDPSKFDPAAFRCQTRSFAQMLDDGIRAFDLRYAYDVTNSSLVFWHGPALQSQTATVDDVMYGFYRWLDQHPSEVVFLSFQYQSSTTPYATNSQGVQSLMFETLTSPAAKQYIQQTTGEIGTLGESRGQIVLLKRFDLDRLPASYDAALPGLHFSPDDWTENGDNITLTLNASTGLTAYIEDYFQPQTSSHSTAEENIKWKLNATSAHLRMAATSSSQNPHNNHNLFWTFASSTKLPNTPPITPVMQALGNGSSVTPLGGVNHQLVPILRELQGQRLGIVMFDFYEEPAELLDLFLGLLPPE
ncbi:hypothetical protein D0869_07202 [Hortaea werneckii]|uniref:Phosphatidylinositol-specific phospholipase C X domain-containing protein n=1 Tax=Hortaea werneckii TaxID=91943 RepID=A0A3M6WRT4_HORWE|nr:hypothetical protein KC324_g11150 [Hortaea werneckii]KAI7565807.1 hypothetical protein KC316_g12521 [Hortaea werneckii]RMX80908.1 hypothetical protein D0869_07202 [Hortaea werneckii]RMY04164.1 hypothetical protein D0868_07094 [Hortaea werneckii]